MTPHPPPDIIGIVKELQERHQKMAEQNLSGLAFDTLYAFPAIAQAMLIAVEALENHCDGDCIHTRIHGPDYRCPEALALAAIHQLTPKQ